jgi:dephospho-CoA kinase
MRPLTVGLTGGIGSGKNVALAEFGALGAVVIDSDDLAREVVGPGTAGLGQVRAAFGPDVFDPDGALDRSRLAALVFADEDARARLEAIVHPLVRARVGQIVEASEQAAVVVNAVPLLAEAGLAGEYDVVVVIQAPVEIRLKRLQQSREMSRDDALARVAAQASDDDRARVATWVVVNDGTIDQLRQRIRDLWPAILARRTM